MEELRKPATLRDDFFGEFVLHRLGYQFEVRKEWCGKPVRLSLDVCQSMEDLLAAAREMWSRQEEWHKRITDYAVAMLLPLKNEAWLDDDEKEVTPAEFVSCMELTSIHLDPDGGFTFWHRDGDLFWGHSIQISGTLAEGPKYADIPG